MRLWHQSLIPMLPRQLLLNLHRDCCRLRGKCWGRGTSSATRWLWNYPIAHLAGYHLQVLLHMELRGYRPKKAWFDPRYRGQKCPSIQDMLHLDIPLAWFKEHDLRRLDLDTIALKKWMVANKQKLGAPLEASGQ